MNDHVKAWKLAKTAFDSAIQDLEKLEDEEYKEAASIMQLLGDNLTSWQEEGEEKKEEENKD